MASFSRSLSEDSKQESESEDPDRILMEGGPVGSNLWYQDEPLAIHNSDSDESDSEEDEDGLLPAVLEGRYDREVAVATWWMFYVYMRSFHIKLLVDFCIGIETCWKYSHSIMSRYLLLRLCRLVCLFIINSLTSWSISFPVKFLTLLNIRCSCNRCKIKLWWHWSKMCHRTSGFCGADEHSSSAGRSPSGRKYKYLGTGSQIVKNE